MSFAQTLRYSIGWEGGKVDHKDDKGGRTCFGITQATFNTWRTSQRVARDDVFTITPIEATRIYRAWYWHKVWGEELDALDARLGLLVFDAAIHHSCGQSVKWVQMSTKQGLAADGIMGPKTLSTLHRLWETGYADQVMFDTLGERRGKFRRIAAANPPQQVFLRGWLSRADDMEKVIEAPETHYTLTLQQLQRKVPKGWPDV